MAGGSADERHQVDGQLDRELPTSGLNPGTTLLISGPPLIGKYDLMLEILAQGIERGEGGIVVSTQGDERAVVRDFERVAPGFDPALLGIVECVSDQQEEGGTTTGEVRIRRTPSPADLTGIGIGASELMNDLSGDGATGVRLGVDSLSTLLLYTEFDRMARFLHVLSGRIDRAGGLGVFVVNPGTIAAGQYDQLKTLFDGLVELREHEDRRELRVRGLPDVDAEWRPYEPTAVE